MKNFIPALIITGMVSMTIIACGPSAEEKAAAEQHMKDSIMMVEKAVADSMLAAQQQMMEDSLAMVKASEDSMAAAKAVQDSIAAVKSARPKKVKSEPKPEVPTVGKKKPGAK